MGRTSSEFDLGESTYNEEHNLSSKKPGEKTPNFRSLLLSSVKSGLIADVPEWHSYIGKRDKDRHALARKIRLTLLAPEDPDPSNRWFADLSSASLARLLQCLEYDYRVEEEPSREQITESTLAFVARQSRVSRITPSFRIDDLAFMRRYVYRILGSDPGDFASRTRHGSGAVAESLAGLDKWLAPVHLPRQIREQFDPLWRLNWLASQDRRSKVAFVPKDSRGPRVIAMEPAGSMLFQEGLMDVMYERLRRAGFNLHDQWAHTSLMLRKQEHVVTIDLKDASDFVSWRCVNLLFPKKWVKVFAELRTPMCVLPNGHEQRVHSAFLMGAAICFPVLTIVCAALSALALKRSGDANLMSVYGDDIIIARGALPYLTFALECAGLVLNHQKSGRGGRMLETCGFDMHDGLNIRPLYVRKCSIEDPAELLQSTMGLQRSFYDRGFFATARNLGHLVDCVYDIVIKSRSEFPFEEWSEVLAYRARHQVPRDTVPLVGCLQGPSTVRRRWNRSISGPEYLGLVLCEETRRTNLAGSGALASALCNRAGTMTPELEPCPVEPRVQLTWMPARAQVLPNKDVFHVLGSAVTL